MCLWQKEGENAKMCVFIEKKKKKKKNSFKNWAQKSGRELKMYESEKIQKEKKSTNGRECVCVCVCVCCVCVCVFIMEKGRKNAKIEKK